MQKIFKFLGYTIGSLLLLVICVNFPFRWYGFIFPSSRVISFFEKGNSYYFEYENRDILIVAGDRIFPNLLERIKDQNMGNRGYAILLLGQKKYRLSLPLLRQIIQDESELYFYRRDALTALYQIDPEEGKQWALKYSDKEDPKNLLYSTSIELLNGEMDRYLRNSYRTYGEAFWGLAPRDEQGSGIKWLDNFYESQRNWD